MFIACVFKSWYVFHFIIILAHFTRNHLVKLFPPFFFYRQPHLTGQLIADAMQQSVYISLYSGSLILKKLNHTELV